MPALWRVTSHTCEGRARGCSWVWGELPGSGEHDSPPLLWLDRGCLRHTFLGASLLLCAVGKAQSPANMTRRARAQLKVGKGQNLENGWVGLMGPGSPSIPSQQHGGQTDSGCPPANQESLFVESVTPNFKYSVELDKSKSSSPRDKKEI